VTYWPSYWSGLRRGWWVLSICNEVPSAAAAAATAG